MIINGKDLPFGQSAAGLPSVAEAIISLFQPTVVGIIIDTQVNGYTQTIVSQYINTKGVRIQDSNNLVISKTGERIWDSVTMYFLSEIDLVADDLFLFNEIQYRVVALETWPEYGYNKYSVLQNYKKLDSSSRTVI